MTGPRSCCWCDLPGAWTLVHRDGWRDAACAAHAEEYGSQGDIRTVVPPTYRKRCAWGEPPHPMDGKGPILPGELVSDGICREHVAAFLGPVTVLPGAGWDADPDGDFLR